MKPQHAQIHDYQTDIFGRITSRIDPYKVTPAAILSEERNSVLATYFENTGYITPTFQLSNGLWKTQQVVFWDLDQTLWGRLTGRQLLKVIAQPLLPYPMHQSIDQLTPEMKKRAMTHSWIRSTTLPDHTPAYWIFVQNDKRDVEFSVVLDQYWIRELVSPVRIAKVRPASIPAFYF